MVVFATEKDGYNMAMSFIGLHGWDAAFDHYDHELPYASEAFKEGWMKALEETA